MQLSDIFDSLAYGPLSQLSLVSEETINQDSINKVINQINLGLVDLHKRFFLKRESHTLTRTEDTNRYPLNSLNLIEVIRVVDPKGKEVPLNPSFDPKQSRFPFARVYTPVYNVLRFENGEPGDYSIEYRAGHTQIPKVTDLSSFDASIIDIQLPMEFLQALSYYIASKVITPLSSAVNGAPNEGIMYSQHYEAECTRLVAYGLDVEQDASNTLFHSKGFV